MNFNDNVVNKILALGLDNSTPDHHLRYLLNKLYGLDSLHLDEENTEFYKRITKIALELRD